MKSEEEEQELTEGHGVKLSQALAVRITLNKLFDSWLAIVSGRKVKVNECLRLLSFHLHLSTQFRSL